MNTNITTTQINKAIDCCIEALNNPIEGTQKSVGDDALVIETIHKASAPPYTGRGSSIVNTITYTLQWLSAIIWLYDFANYTEDEMLESAQKIVNADIIFNHILKHIITSLTKKDKIDEAVNMTKHFKKTVIFRKEEDNQDKGYLIILEYYAKKGDDKNFFKYFKLSKPAINKTEVYVAKRKLVQHFTLQNGVQKSLELCQHKNLGKGLHSCIVEPFAQAGRYGELKAIFVQYPELKNPEQETELSMLTSACYHAKNKNIIILEDDFEELFARALKVDRKIRFGDCKLQNWILLNLGLASKGNVKRMIMCRKAIKNNSLKRELEIK
ncbi:hypothetical protein [Flavobacterium chilense]|uniref:Uncharacterized protein n=1 Tax=Flavobacterium chilense TaxID=946677 RepID=A0A1M7F590_9FLAO|nr:hypothetical protein [Flavobacterium chilense]SHL99155.1 hypothetical protein SAMN05444484_103229 [Flavobacterium chilense]